MVFGCLFIQIFNDFRIDLSKIGGLISIRLLILGFWHPQGSGAQGNCPGCLPLWPLLLPNQIEVDEERWLRVSWDVKNNLFFVKSNLDKPSKKPKMIKVSLAITQNLLKRMEIKLGHTIRAGGNVPLKTL